MHRLGSIVSILALASLLVVGCGAGTDEPSASSDGSQPIVSRGPETDAPLATESLDPNLPPQSESEWGRIWNSLPPSFPVFAGAEVVESDEGPVSGAYAVATDLATPLAIAEFYRDAIEEGAFGGTGLDGPLEDGSYAVWSSNGYGCESLVKVLPRGPESLVTVLYGAGCDFN